MSRSIISIMMILSVTVLHGCSLWPISLEVTSKSRLNPDRHQQSLTLVLRAYLLSDDKLFRSASFQQLWLADKLTLGETLLAVQEWRQSVNQRHDIQFRRIPKAKYVAVVALFRQPLISKWRLTRSLHDKWYTAYQTLGVQLHSNTITWAQA